MNETVNNVIGAIGGFVLAACLAPQLLRMYTTRSAFDLSYFFVVFYIIGLILTFIYMVFVNALVGYIAVAAEIVLGTVMLIGKIYLDYWGPYSKRKTTASAPGLTIPAKMRLEMSKFLSGRAAPFPLMQAEAAHAAAHLLLDCQLGLSSRTEDSEISVEEHEHEHGRGKPSDGAADLVAAESGLGNGTVNGVKGSLDAQTTFAKLQGLHLSEFADMLETCLDESELDIYRRQTHAFVSFKNRGLSSANDGEGNGTAGGGGNLCFVPCKDGYVTAMWVPESATLAVDFVGAAPDTITKLNVAAESFCRELSKTHPGTKIVASAVSRLPNL